MFPDNLFGHLVAEHPGGRRNDLAELHERPAQVFEAFAQGPRQLRGGRAKLRGADHPETLRVENSLANVLQDQGKFADAEKKFREVLRKFKTNASTSQYAQRGWRSLSIAPLSLSN